jgi:hypothetical protein
MIVKKMESSSLPINVLLKKFMEACDEDIKEYNKLKESLSIFSTIRRGPPVRNLQAPNATPSDDDSSNDEPNCEPNDQTYIDKKKPNDLKNVNSFQPGANPQDKIKTSPSCTRQEVNEENKKRIEQYDIAIYISTMLQEAYKLIHGLNLAIYDSLNDESKYGAAKYIVKYTMLPVMVEYENVTQQAATSGGGAKRRSAKHKGGAKPPIWQMFLCCFNAGHVRNTVAPQPQPQPPRIVEPKPQATHVTPLSPQEQDNLDHVNQKKFKEFYDRIEMIAAIEKRIGTIEDKINEALLKVDPLDIAGIIEKMKKFCIARANELFQFPPSLPGQTLEQTTPNSAKQISLLYIEAYLVSIINAFVTIATMMNRRHMRITDAKLQNAMCCDVNIGDKAFQIIITNVPPKTNVTTKKFGVYIIYPSTDPNNEVIECITESTPLVNQLDSMTGDFQLDKEITFNLKCNINQATKTAGVANVLDDRVMFFVLEKMLAHIVPVGALQSHMQERKKMLGNFQFHNGIIFHPDMIADNLGDFHKDKTPYKPGYDPKSLTSEPTYTFAPENLLAVVANMIKYQG